MTKTYRIQDREAGNVFETGLTPEKAQEILAIFEAEDKQYGLYTEDFYEIVQED